MRSGRRILPPSFRSTSPPAGAIADWQTSFNQLRIGTGVVQIYCFLLLVSTCMYLSFASRFDALTLQSLRRLASGVLPDACVEERRLPLTFPDPSLGIRLTAAVDVVGSFFICSVKLVQPPHARFLQSHTHPCSQDPDFLAEFATCTGLVPAPDCIPLAHILRDSLSQRNPMAPVHCRRFDSHVLGDNCTKASQSSRGVCGAKDWR